MEEIRLDRQAFVNQQGKLPRPSSSLIGPIIFLAVVGLAGYVAYAFLRGNKALNFGGGDPQLAQIAKRLDEMEKRLDQIENRRRAQPSVAAPSPASPQPAAPSSSSSVARSSSPPSLSITPRRTPDSVVIPKTSEDPRVAKLQQEFYSLQSDTTADREAWEASTDRLGDAVGELGSQREEIARTRESVEQLRSRLDRTRFPFQLHRNGGRQRIGPVWLQLRSTDPKRQRYSMGLLLDDKWIEMKDRALGERLEFYVSGGADPIELVVSEIGRDQVGGLLAMPKANAQP